MNIRVLNNNYLDENTTYDFDEERYLNCQCGTKYRDIKSFKKHALKCDGKKTVLKETETFGSIIDGKNSLFG
jgi:uncharacterized C2H2 Zn-finger protein